MRTSQRHHLKENELALAIGRANVWAGRNQRKVTTTAIALAVIGVAAIAFVTWRNYVDSQSRALLAEAMVIDDARVVPPPADATTPPPAPQPGSYPSEKSKLEAALPKFLAAADAYPSTDAGRTARYHAAATLARLSRFDEALQQYDRVINAGSGLVPQMARLGKAETQVRAKQYDQAIASFKELSERTDLDVPKEALLLELARAYKLAGKNDDARKTLTQIVEQHAQSPFAAEAKTELERIQS